MAKRSRSTRKGGASKAGRDSRSAEEAADLRLLARDAALAGLERLARLSQSDDERIALAATQELLNRAFGKAPSSGLEEAVASRPVIIKIVRFGKPEPESEGGQRGGKS